MKVNTAKTKNKIKSILKILANIVAGKTSKYQ